MEEDEFKMTEEDVLLYEILEEKFQEFGFLYEDEVNAFIKLREKIQLHYEPLCKMLKKQYKLPYFKLYGLYEVSTKFYTWDPVQENPYEKGLLLLNANTTKYDLMVPIDVLFMTEKELSKIKFKHVHSYLGVEVYDV